MRGLKRTFRALVFDQEGLETIEYAIITGLITGSVLITISAIAAWLAYKFGVLQSVLGG